jgi:hypothetical protein
MDAPSGRVRTYAAQKASTAFILKPRCATVTRAISAAKVAASAMAKMTVVRSRG